ncbi:hypothetical protein AVEN_236451-1 [Araneus ventricosus]|uniref:Uncharacterized protein n=1 Tax=Araneus ventricosus TaxID=182803 RepID=A0A4Y2IVI2_ARAVE|nr:hypothetical protein AVEN_236451-1 [Araneus ventricosus]
MLPVSVFVLSGLEEDGGLVTACESSKSSDILYSNVSPSDAEEELISVSASDSRDCKTLFSPNGGKDIDIAAEATKGVNLASSEITVALITGCIFELFCLTMEASTSRDEV